MAKKPKSKDVPVGELIQKHRTEVLKQTLREASAALGVAPAHLSDIEHGRRAPSEELLVRIAKVYRIEEPVLRAGWSRADPAVNEIASKNAHLAAAMPELLRTAATMTPEQLAKLLQQARRLSGKPPAPKD